MNGALLIDTAALERVNAITVGGAIILRLTEMGVNFDKINRFICNGTRYVTAYYRNIIKHICQNAVHITCSHMLFT